MKNYINKQGEITKVAPESLIEIEDCFTGKVIKIHKVIVLRTHNELEPVAVGCENFTEEPTKGNILWAIAKHKGDSAEIRIMYEPEID